MFSTSLYDVPFNFESSLGNKEKKCDKRMNERTNEQTNKRTDGVTMSLLELLIAAKNSNLGKIQIIIRLMSGITLH